MPLEQQHEIKREQRGVVAIPEAVVERLQADDTTDARLKAEDKFTTTHEFYRTAVLLPGVADAQLSIQYERIRDELRQQHDARVIVLSYGIVDGGVEQPVASLEFERLAERRYYLRHRYVESEYRDRRGIGTQLLHQAEALIQQIADRTQRRQRIEVNLGQRSVLNWLLKNGYQADASSNERLDRVRNHPAEFIFHEIDDVGDQVDRPDGIFPAGTTQFKFNNTVRIRLYKTIVQQRTANRRAAVASLLDHIVDPLKKIE